MSLTNPNTPVSQQDLQDFYHKILPYMGGSSGGSGGGHTIEDAEGTDLTQRDTLQFGEGLSATDDSTNEKTVVDIDPMPAEDMDDVIDELPTGGNIAVTGYVPLAMIMQYYGETPPKFFLACDGATYNKADYPELAKHLLSLTNNTPYIVDGDDTKFKVPDLRGEFLRGTGTNSHTNQGSGANVGVHQDGTEHPNVFFDDSVKNFAIPNTKASGSTVVSNIDKGFASGGTGQGRFIYAEGSWQGQITDVRYYTSRPTNTSVLFCIAYKDIYSNPMNDYSTDEKVVGTWIDGKPIYEKVLRPSSDITITTSMTNIHDVSDLNIETLVEGAVHRFPNQGTSMLETDYDSGYIRAKALGVNLPYYTNGFTVIQYTKTTD